MKYFLQPFKSKNILLIIALAWIVIMGCYKPWQKNLVINDVVSYYAYLPATVIEKDITLKFAAGDTAYREKYWPETAPNGGRVIKTTMGLSLLYAPFFLLGHATALMFDLTADGFSVPYRIFLLLGCLFYLLLGFYYLRKLLLLFFSEQVTGLTLLSVFFGTNLLWYSTFNGLMSHGYLFAFVTVFVYNTVKWHAEPKLRTAVFIGLSGGLITLIRPTMILCFLVVALYNVYNKQSLAEKIKLFKNNLLSLLLIVLFFFLVLLPQLIYWKYITGNFLFFSYVGERFYWDHPHITEGLFGFRKGWLLYTPIMAFAVTGIFFLRKQLPAFFLPLAVLLPLLVYVFFSWWAWWYGGSFGQRPFVDFYGLFAIPMACFYAQVLKNKVPFVKQSVLTLMVLFIALNLFQTWQVERGLLHYDSMTKEAYVAGFFNTDEKDDRLSWFNLLDDPDYDRARKGLPENYSEQEIKKIIPSDIITLKGFTQWPLGYEEKDSFKPLKAIKGRVGKAENFSIIFLADNKIAIKANNNKYLSVNPGPLGKVYAEAEEPGPRQQFEIIYLDGRIALKAFNNRYVGVQNAFPFELYAKSKHITSNELFRIYIN